MRTRISRRRRRPKRRMIWTGLELGGKNDATFPLSIPTDTDVGSPTFLALELAGPTAEAPLTTATDLLVLRVLFGFYVSNGGLLNSLLRMELAVVETDLDEIPLTNPPEWGDPDAIQKRTPMWTGSYWIEAGSGIGTSMATAAVTINNGLMFDIKVKRKLTGDQALIMKFQSGAVHSAEPVGVPLTLEHFYARCLISGGRR